MFATTLPQGTFQDPNGSNHHTFSIPGPAAKEAQLASRAADKDPTLRRFLLEAPLGQ